MEAYVAAHTEAVVRPIEDRLRENVSIFDFIPTALQAAILDCTSTVDVSRYVQAAIDAVSAAGGGTIEHPHGLFNVSGVLLKPGVGLVGKGSPGTYGYAHATPPVNKTVYQAVSAGWILNAPDNGGGSLCGTAGIDFRGLGADVAAMGVYIGISNYWCFVKNAQFNNFSGQALVMQGLAGAVEDILLTNCLLATPTAKTGVVEIGGTDNYAYRIESAGSAGTVTDPANLFVCAISVTGSNNFISNCVGETADVGIYVPGDWNKFTGVRADLNWGNGWEITGGTNLFSASHGHNNSKATTNTCDNWVVTGSNNVFGACVSSYVAAPLPRFSLNDNTNGDVNKNVYGADCNWGTDFGTATFNFQGFAGSAVQVPAGPRKTFPANSATPSVMAYGRFATSNTSATAITNFTDATPGQLVAVYVNDAFTSFVNNGATLATAGGATKRAVQGQWYLFIYENGLWSEIAGDQAFRASKVFNPPGLLAGRQASTTVAVKGAALGDAATATFSVDLRLVGLSAYVSAADTVTCLFSNGSGTGVDLGSGTLKVAVRPG